MSPMHHQYFHSLLCACPEEWSLRVRMRVHVHVHVQGMMRACTCACCACARLSVSTPSLLSLQGPCRCTSSHGHSPLFFLLLLEVQISVLHAHVQQNTACARTKKTGVILCTREGNCVRKCFMLSKKKIKINKIFFQYKNIGKYSISAFLLFSSLPLRSECLLSIQKHSSKITKRMDMAMPTPIIHSDP